MTLKITIEFVSDLEKAQKILALLQDNKASPEPKTEPRVEPKAESKVPPGDGKTYTGEELRRAALAKAKEVGVEAVKEFVKSLGLKSIVDVAPEDSADVLRRLQELKP